MRTNTQRLQSLDALRGFDMFWIIGGSNIFVGLATLTGWPVLEWWAAQMNHVEWNGFAFYDLIFPLFLFIAGISFPFSLEKSRQRGDRKNNLYFRIFKRGLLLVIFGLVYNGLLKFDFDNQRYASVLGRIGLAWMFAALIFINTKRVTRIIWCLAILVLYWLILAFIQAPDYPDAVRFSIEGNFASYVDRTFQPGRLYDNLYDPSGLSGIFPAISTALIGMLTGEFVMSYKEGMTGMKKAGCLAIAGLVFIVVALLWDMVFPINKKLWSSSFVCLAGGLSLLLFSLFYLVIDVLGYRKWSFFFVIIGLNSITIYLAQVMINFRYTSRFIFGGFTGLFPGEWTAVLDAIAYVVICWVFLYFLYRQKIFLKV